MLHDILWAILILFVVLWLLGLVLHIGRCFIYLLLIGAVVILILNVVSLLYHLF